MIAASEAASLALRPPPIYLEGKLPVIEATVAQQLGLRNEQVVQANVESQAGQWFLRFQSGARIGLTRDWLSAHGLTSGDTAQFKVQIQPDGSIVLYPVGEPSRPGQTVATQTPNPLLPDRMAQLTVRPQDMRGLQELLQPGVLEQLARQVGEIPGPLAQWLRSRPSMGNLSAEWIRAWLMQSGWFNEGLLGTGRSPPSADLKSALRALQRSMQQGQDGKVRLLEDALDDIESSQLAMVHGQAGGGEMVAGVILAFRDMPPVRMNIRRHGNGSDEGGTSFMVDLQMQTPDLGDVWLRTRISDGSKLDMTMWATRPDVVTLAQSQSSGLRQQLMQAGLHLQSLNILWGKAPGLETESQGKSPGQVLDVLT